MSIYLYENHRGKYGSPIDFARCRHAVHETGRGVGFYQCSRKVSVTRDGIGFCAAHDPEKQAVKERARNAVADADRHVDDARYELQSAQEHLVGYIVERTKWNIETLTSLRSRVVEARANLDDAGHARA